MKVRYKRRDFEFVEVGSRFVLLCGDIHIVQDASRRRQARSWEAMRKRDDRWSGMGESRFKTPENAARAALEYWGF